MKRTIIEKLMNGLYDVVDNEINTAAINVNRMRILGLNALLYLFIKRENCLGIFLIIKRANATE